MTRGHGKLDIASSSFDRTKIDAGAGETVINDSKLNDLKLNAGVGRVEINGEITGDSRIECGIGEMDIVLSGAEENYKIVAEKGIGSLKIKGKSHGRRNYLWRWRKQNKARRWNRQYKH